MTWSSQSSRPMTRPSTMDSTTIMRVALTSSGRVGQVTFLSSSRTETRQDELRWNHPVSRFAGCLTCTLCMLLGLFVRLMRVAVRAILPPLYPFRVLPLVLIGEEVAALTLGALKDDLVSWHLYSQSEVTSREPRVEVDMNP